MRSILGILSGISLRLQNGHGICFYTGVGMFTGDLSDMYNNYGVFGVAFDKEHKKFSLYLRNYIGFARAKQDQENAVVM